MPAWWNNGWRDIFVLVFLHLETRRVFVTPATCKTGEAWMREQADAFVQHVKDSGLKAEIVMHDRDCKFTEDFDFDQTLGHLWAISDPRFEEHDGARLTGTWRPG